MTEAAAPNAGPEHTRGRLHYLDPSVSPSLYRNGRVLTRRDSDGSDGGTEGVILEAREVTIHNARLLAGGDRRTLARDGFELLLRPLARSDLDFFDHGEVVEHYYPECAAAVREATGARDVFAFDHNIRSATGKAGQRRIRGGQQVQGPAHVAHGDYTLTSAPDRLRLLAKPPSGNDTLRSFLAEEEALLDLAMVDRALGQGSRYAIINVWRNIVQEPVATHPLALCDAQSVSPEDLVVFEIHYQDRVGENYFAIPSPRHQLFYFPAMTWDDALLIKQWDSAGTMARSRGERADGDDPGAPCTFSFHTAFEDAASPPDAPDRWSIEVRCAVLYG